jgi:predicted RNA-binding Zn ribbon-like protein
MERYTFRRSDLVGGHVVLDLVNTVTGRDSQPTDWLEDYGRLVEWAALTDTFDETTLRALERWSAADERAATRALGRLRTLREAVYGVAVAMIRTVPPREGAVAQLERDWKSATRAARIAVENGRATLGLDAGSSRLELPRHALALAALELLEALPLERTRECANPPCTAIFIDTSRGGQRRWCDMATCGNAAKSRRHYARGRAAASD